jgi:hypothetical protein
MSNLNLLHQHQEMLYFIINVFKLIEVPYLSLTYLSHPMYTTVGVSTPGGPWTDE